MPTYRKEPSPDSLLAMTLGAKYQALQEPLTEDIQKMIRQVEQRVFTAISKGELNPEQAQQAWYEVHAYRRLLQKFNQRIKVGVMEGENLQPMIGEANNG